VISLKRTQFLLGVASVCERAIAEATSGIIKNHALEATDMKVKDTIQGYMLRSQSKGLSFSKDFKSRYARKDHDTFLPVSRLRRSQKQQGSKSDNLFRYGQIFYRVGFGGALLSSFFYINCLRERADITGFFPVLPLLRPTVFVLRVK
jgi:hypothetical protein